MADSISVFVSISDIAYEIESCDSFNELINELAEKDYDYIGKSDEELTDEGKKLIIKLAKQIEEMDSK